MLTQLRIENYVLIDKVDLRLGAGLTAITGETGSGKSILLGALTLILGERADLSTLRNQSDKCVLEATFRLSKAFAPLFELHDLDFDADTIIRREISATGKSRSFINDTPVNLKVLKVFGERLVDIHSQMETSRLRNGAFRFELLDAAASQREEVSRWQTRYRSWRKALEQLENLREQEARSKLDLDYFKFQLDELQQAGLDRDDWDALAEEAETLRHAKRIHSALREAGFVLDESDDALIPALKRIAQTLEQVSDVHAPTRELHERLKGCSLELQDIAMECAATADGVDDDPQRLANIEERLDLLYTLENKHRVSGAAQLRDVHDALQQKVLGIGSLEDEIKRLSLQTQELRASLESEAKAIHAQRMAAAQRLEGELNEVLHELKMPDARMVFELTETDELNGFGKSTVQWLFTANQGTELQPLEKAASGGELSRVMLALKAVISRYQELPTLILDEIDTGVSGDVAARMAEVMQAMAESMQVLSISHLPQVAGKAKQHLKVFKEVSEGQTFTRLTMVSGDQRIEELAAMLSGESVTESAREHARSLLSEN